jgi:peptidoglycan hydrolase CwlO-like protein
VYAETIEVVNILKEMLEDIKTRFEVIDKVDNEAKKLMDDVMAKMVEWEGKLVALGNAKDKAKALQDAAKLEREKLNGDNHVIEVAATEDRKAAKVMIPPYEREIYVITMIKKKIIDKCAAETPPAE